MSAIFLLGSQTTVKSLKSPGIHRSRIYRAGILYQSFNRSFRSIEHTEIALCNNMEIVTTGRRQLHRLLRQVNLCLATEGNLDVIFYAAVFTNLPVWNILAAGAFITAFHITQRQLIVIMLAKQEMSPLWAAFLVCIRKKYFCPRKCIFSLFFGNMCVIIRVVHRRKIF